MAKDQDKTQQETGEIRIVFTPSGRQGKVAAGSGAGAAANPGEPG